MIYNYLLPAILLVRSLEASIADCFSLTLKSTMLICPLQWEAGGGGKGAWWEWEEETEEQGVETEEGESRGKHRWETSL